jgi:hypothetical protein
MKHNSINFTVNMQNHLYDIHIEEKPVDQSISTTAIHNISGLSLDEIKTLRDCLNDFLWNRYNEGF